MGKHAMPCDIYLECVMLVLPLSFPAGGRDTNTYQRLLKHTQASLTVASNTAGAVVNAHISAKHQVYKFPFSC